MSLLQYYRQARISAIQMVYTDYIDESLNAMQNRDFKYPRPLSEPSSPSSSRRTTPAPSEIGSDEDDVDEDLELHQLKIQDD